MNFDIAYLYGIVQRGSITMSLSTTTVTEALSLRKSTSARNLVPFEACSQSNEKFLLAVSCLTIHLSAYISTVPAGWISVNWILGTLIKIFWKSPN
jgi:hypothetical protein